MIRAFLNILHTWSLSMQRPQGNERALHPSAADEEKLLDHLISECWEQGCWLPYSVLEHALAPESQIELIEQSSTRKSIHREGKFQNVPESLRQDSDDPDDDIWIITSQRCDIIKSLSSEPVVTCVRATKHKSKEARGRTNKGRHNTLYTVRENGTSAWVADFKQVILT